MTLRANQLAGIGAAIAEVRALAAPADTLLHHFFRRHPAMGQHDRARIADAVFAYLRRRRSLETLAHAAWLAEFKSRLGTELAPAVAADLPDWLWQRLGAAFGEDERIELARAWLAPASLDLRANPLKVTRDAARKALAASGLELE